MKILLLSPIPPPSGGIATWTIGYIESIEAKKNFIDIVNTSVIGNREYDFNKKSKLEEINRTYKIIFNMVKKMESIKPDIVHVNTSCSRFGMIRDLICINISKFKGIKTILHCHCDTEYMIKDNLSRYIFKKMCKISDKILVLNKSSYNHIKILSNKESSIVPNFIKQNTIENLNAKLKSEKVNHILYVGRVVKSKGCDNIIEVAKQMPDKTFTIIGSISKEIKSMHITSNVKLLGELKHEDVLKNMDTHDVFLFPTHTEGFPNVILEAMANGMPIISTGVGAILDMLEDNGGIIIDVNNNEQIIQAINTLENRDIRLSMGVWNKNKVNKFYTRDTVIEQIFREYV